MRGFSTRELLERLQRHYIKPGAPLPGGIFLPEVGWNGGKTGAGGCDAIYVGFTSTSGRILVGHELKVSRADWLHELNSPGKADGWADECHEWWLVVADPKIVLDGELPAGWGMMAPGKSVTRMQVLQNPTRKPATHTPSWDAVRSIMARQDTLRANAIIAGKQRAADAARAELKEQVDREVDRRAGITPEVDRARALVAAIRNHSRFLSIPREPDFDAVSLAVCEVLEGHRLLAELRALSRNRLSAIENALRDLKADYSYKTLIELMGRADEAVSA